MSRAISWAATRSRTVGGQFLAVNTGADTWNYQVKQLANAVADRIPNTTVSINKAAVPDKRSYQVDFSLYKALAPDHQPCDTLDQTVQDLYEGLTTIQFSDRNYRQSDYVRLNVLSKLQHNNTLSKDLYWHSEIR